MGNSTYIFNSSCICLTNNVFLGGIDSSAAPDNSDTTLQLQQQVFNDESDGEIDNLFGIIDEEKAQKSGAFQKQSKGDSREKISKFLNNEKERRMTPKQSLNKQHLSIAKEDLALKRKMIETSDRVDQEFLSNTSKMTKTMEGVGNAITGCFDLMKKMYEGQQKPPAYYNSGFPSANYQETPFAFNQYYPSNCFNTNSSSTYEQPK